MRAGRLRKRVTVQQNASTTRDSYGNVAPSWTTYATRWAAVEPLSGSERIDAAQVEAGVSHLVTMRYDSTAGGITPKMRISYDSRTLEIERVLNIDERNRELQLACKEVV